MSDICQPVNIITEYPSEPVQFMELERNMGENKLSLIQKLLVSLPFSHSLFLFPFSAFLFFSTNTSIGPKKTCHATASFRPSRSTGTPGEFREFPEIQELNCRIKYIGRNINLGHFSE